MIDPIHSLAFSIQANKGVYAVLVGSGLSRAAKIPTGWEITLDLVRKLAVIQGDIAEPDHEAWYLEKFEKDPDYSDLLEKLARTQAERQQLLRTYWEPNEQEREVGEKRPTAAHHAIAALVAQGFIRVIITTNFDRLMESALRDAGVEPTVLSSPDHVRGALPLVHTRCCVLKLHGDYLDTRIRNTPTELETYPKEFDKLLDQIFDEFGLIVCGWSADWDNALCNAIYRCPSRRFATYWTVCGEPRDTARRLIKHRMAEVIAIEDADSFFQTVQQHVQSIEEYSRPYPLSTAAAVASLKRYLSEPKYRIQLSDLVDETVDRVVETVSGETFAVQGGPTPDGNSLTARVRGYEVACSTLLEMALIGGFWVQKDHFCVWRQALERLSKVRENSGNTLWLKLQRYPATLLLYALGLGALGNNHLEFLGCLFATIIDRENGQDIFTVQTLPPWCLIRSGNSDVMQSLEGMERHHVPLNDWLHNKLRQCAKGLIPGDDRYTLIFDKLEILIALSYAFQSAQSKEEEQWQWVPMGAFGYRHENRSRVLQEIEKSISELSENSPFVRSGIFGKTVEDCSQSLQVFKRVMMKIRWW